MSEVALLIGIAVNFLAVVTSAVVVTRKITQIEETATRAVRHLEGNVRQILQDHEDRIRALEKDKR